MSTSETRAAARCASCSQPANFNTPVGVFCSDHAMFETLNQVIDKEKWMPVPIQPA